MSRVSRGYLTVIAVLVLLVVFLSSLCRTAFHADAASAVLALLGLVVGAWFIRAFVLNPLPSQGDGRETALTDIYAFAYTATLLAVVLLALPFGNLVTRGSFPESGPIRLIRGCVERPSSIPPAAVASAASAPEWPQGLPLCREDSDVHTVLIAIGGVIASNRPAERLVPPPASQAEAASGVAAAASPVVAGSAPTEARARPRANAPAAASIASAAALAAAPAVSPAMPAAPQAAEPCATCEPGSQPPATYRVRDGFVVPMMMVVLAMVGGIVNLMRRLPEFQKRAHVEFTGNDKQMPLMPFEAREFVAFQLLQMISAPFIAMVALYVIAPNSLPAAIALAFASGLFSEAVLLRLSAMVEGPGKTPTVATLGAVGELQVNVTTGNPPMPATNAQVTVTEPSGGKVVRRATTDATGAVTLKLVPTGALDVTADSGVPGSVPQTQQVTLAAGQAKVVSVRL